MSSELKIEIIATGNELLDGSTLDRHTQSIALALKKRGLRIHRMQMLPDDLEVLSRAFAEAAIRSRVVMVIGGLGPTEDDLSLEVASKTFKRPLMFSKAAEKNVLARMKQLGRTKLNEGHRKQMLIPEGSQVLVNQEGTAPGIELPLGNCTFYFLPGVPAEFSEVFYKSVLNRLDRNFQLREENQRDYILKIFGWPESELNLLVRKYKLPEGVEVGFRTHFPENHIKFRLQGDFNSSKRREFEKLLSKLRNELGSAVFSENAEETFEESFLRKLLPQKLKLCFAESCTGGLATAMLTRVPGSSKVLERGFVVYSNEAKRELLGVRAETLEKHGAVSEEVVKEMALGALKNSKADRAVSISGIAGPSGGSPQKPVGTVWFGYADQEGELKAHKIYLQGRERAEVQLYSAYFALHYIAEA